MFLFHACISILFCKCLIVLHECLKCFFSFLFHQVWRQINHERTFRAVNRCIKASRKYSGGLPLFFVYKQNTRFGRSCGLTQTKLQKSIFGFYILNVNVHYDCIWHTKVGVFCFVWVVTLSSFCLF